MPQRTGLVKRIVTRSRRGEFTLLPRCVTPHRVTSPDPTAPPASLDPRRRRIFLAGLLLVTLVTLALEVLFTRLLSVLTWYSLAFLVIAMGLFGLTAGAVRVWARAEQSIPETFAALSRDARLLAIAIPAAYILLLVVPLRITPTLTTVFLFLVFAAIIAMPFVAAGMVVATALTRVPIPIGRVYAVDLAGAAVGAALVPALIDYIGADSAILLLGVVAAVAAFAFGKAAGERKLTRGSLLAGAAVLALLFLHGATSRGLVPIWVKGHAEDRDLLEIETWNSHSRVQVSREGTAPAALWGAGTRCSIPTIRERAIVIDGDAATPVFYPEHGLEDLRFLACDVTNLAHSIRPNGPAAIIGVGGSRDVQAALMFGHRPVVGIEFNRKLLGILRGRIGRGTFVTDNPDVTLVGEEARSYLSRTSQRFRLIQASLIDTWASTGAGAHALGENGLYTLEAWRMFLQRLEPDGVFTVSRWASGETVRLVSLASAALMSIGVEHPENHVVLARGGTVTTIIVSRNPLSPDDVAKLQRTCDDRGFELIMAPGLPPRPDSLLPWLRAASRRELDRMTLTDTLDFRPPTDDRPFFFNVVRPRAFWRQAPPGAAGLIEGNRAATAALVLAFLVSIVLSLIAIVVPLWMRRRSQTPHAKAPVAAIAYFSLIGVGFMLFEIGILQRLTVLLGQPDLSLRVVLASIVGSAAVGAWASDKLPLDRAPWCYVYPLVIATAGVAVALLLPPILARAQLFDNTWRIVTAVAVCSVSGALLGIAFPTGMRLVAHKHHRESPWLWGINGVGSVVASSLAVIVALEWGLHWLFVLSALCYVALIPAIARMRRASLAPSLFL